jgi:hypothetical protein
VPERQAGQEYKIMFTMGGRTYPNRVAALQHITGSTTDGGWRRPVTGLFMPTGSDGGYCHWYHSFQWHMTFAEYGQLARVAQRLRVMHHYFTQVHPGWTYVEGSRIYYADNSTEITQRARDGRTRTVSERSPSGDLCF